MTGFIEHGLYFRLAYADAGRHCPVIDTFIYLGKNLFSSDGEDTWYFQCACDFGIYGSFLRNKREGAKMIALGQKEVGCMLSSVGLIQELRKY
jgi:hypothetical protein